MNFVVSANHREKKRKENEKRDKYFELARELKKPMEHEGDGDSNYNWCAQNDPQKFGKGAG